MKRVEKYDSECLVKGRNEPCRVMYPSFRGVRGREVLEVIAACHQVSVEEAASVIYNSTLKLYFPWEL